MTESKYYRLLKKIKVNEKKYTIFVLHGSAVQYLKIKGTGLTFVLSHNTPVDGGGKLLMSETLLAGLTTSPMNADQKHKVKVLKK